MARRKTPAAGAPPGTAHPRALFTPADLKLIHELDEQGWTQREIAERMTEILVDRQERAANDPIRHQVIGKILRGERYAAE